jgi:hypothetical protein
MATYLNAHSTEMSHDEASDPLAYLGTDVDTRQLFKDAGTFLGIIDNLLTEDQHAALDAANPYLWAIEREANQHDDRMVWHFGFVLALTELCRHPEALHQAVCNFRQRLADLLPPPFNVLDTLDEETARLVLDAFGRIVEEA